MEKKNSEEIKKKKKNINENENLRKIRKNQYGNKLFDVIFFFL